MKHRAPTPFSAMLCLALSLSPVKAADYFFAHSAGTYNFNYALWKLNASNGNLIQTLVSGVPAPVGGLAYVNGYLWAQSAGTYNLSYRLWKIDPANGAVVQTLTSGVTAPVGGMTYTDGYFWAHSANMYSPNNLLWKLDPNSGTLVQTLTSGATLPVGALAYVNGYLWAHSSGTYNFNYVLWKLDPANGTAVQTLISGVPAAIGGLAGADGYLWAHSANPYNFSYMLWKLNPTNGNVIQTLTSGVSLPVGALAYVEGTPPTGSISINGGAEYANSAAVNLALSATDNNGVVSFMRFSNNNSTWSAWEAYTTSKAWTLAAGEGLKTTYVQFQDQTGNISSSYADSIIVDTAAPTGTITINSGAVLTTNRSVALGLAASDSGSGVSQMRFSNDNAGWGNWEIYATDREWILASGDGTKSAYVQFKDNAGNASSSFSDTIRFYIKGGIPTNITFQASNNWLELSWPPDHIGWRLQVQTNSATSDWSDWPGATTTNRVKLPMVPANRAVFFRNAYP